MTWITITPDSSIDFDKQNYLYNRISDELNIENLYLIISRESDTITLMRLSDGYKDDYPISFVKTGKWEYLIIPEHIRKRLR